MRASSCLAISFWYFLSSWGLFVSEILSTIVLDYLSLEALNSLILDDLSSFGYSLISVMLRSNLLAFFEIGSLIYANFYRLLYCSYHVKTFLLKPITSINSQWTISAADFLILSNSAFTFWGSSSPCNYSLAFGLIS